MLQTSQKTNKKWMSGYFGQCLSGSADNFLHRQMCWFRLGTFNCGFVSKKKKMGLHGSCRKCHLASKAKGVKSVFFGTPQILKSTLQNLCHPSWPSKDSFYFPHGPFSCCPTTFRIHVYLLCIDSIHEGIRLPSADCLLSSSTDSLVCSQWCLMSVLIAYWSEVALSTTLWMLTTLTGFETGLRRGRTEVASIFSADDKVIKKVIEKIPLTSVCTAPPEKWGK